MLNILISAEKIKERVSELAKEISRDYKNKELLIIGILKGSFIFASDLIRLLDLNEILKVHIDFLKVSSYKDTKSTGKIQVIQDMAEDIHKKHVLIIEDIVDTGLTVQKIIKDLQEQNPESIEICTLLNKPSKRKNSFYIKYKGFDIEDLFVVGYGLDYNQEYRNFPEIRIFEEKKL